MNKGYFISYIVLLWLCCSVNISYACNLPPDACICNCPKYTSMDTFVYFDGSCSSDLDGDIVDWRWYWPPQAYDIIYYHPWEVSCKFNATGIYTVNLEVEDDKGATDDFNCTVYVIKVDLDIVGMSESEEDDPGRYIAVNTDDDDSNSLQDKDEHGTVDNEDDLVEISLSIEPNMPKGYIKLEVGYYELLSAWMDPTKGTSVIDPYHPTEPTTEAIWNLSEESFPATLWVEAYFVHNLCPYDGFGLSYLHPDDMQNTIDWDVVRFNPVEVRLIMDGVIEDNEEFPGNFIGYNDDDDDGDGLLDFIDYDNPDEDDLVKITPGNVYPTNKLTGTVTFDVTQVGPQVRVWESKTKGNEISLPVTYNTPLYPLKIFYVEGFEPSNDPRDVEFTLTYTKEGLTFEDKVKVTVVGVDLHATDLDGSTVSNQYEEVPGVYLHFNIDNDNDSSNSTPPSPSTKLPGADYYETTNPVTNEDDVKLLEMSLRPSLNFGTVILSTPASTWLWESPTKGSSNFFLTDGSKTWDLSDEDERNDFLGHCSTLYVEGMNTGSGDIVLIYEYPVVGNDIHSDKVCYDFIAAYCGDQPRTEEEDILKALNPPDTSVWVPINGHKQRDDLEVDSWPNLKRCQYSITGNLATRPGSGGKRCTIPEYNCIAWSVDEAGSWYSQAYIAHNYGDKDDVFEIEDMDAFYYETKAWLDIGSGTDEEKAEQAEAMYYSNFHAARKKTCGCGAGKWIMYESKTGQWEKIEHVWNQLNGTTYGTPIRFYK